jgi:hypothetical protein
MMASWYQTFELLGRLRTTIEERDVALAQPVLPGAHFGSLINAYEDSALADRVECDQLAADLGRASKVVERATVGLHIAGNEGRRLP